MIDKIKDWWKYDIDWDLLKFMLMFLLIFTLLMGLVVGYNKTVCDRYERLSPDFHWSFSFWGGCLVQTHTGRWISPDRFFQLEDVTP